MTLHNTPNPDLNATTRSATMRPDLANSAKYQPSQGYSRETIRSMMLGAAEYEDFQDDILNAMIPDEDLADPIGESLNREILESVAQQNAPPLSYQQTPQNYQAAPQGYMPPQQNRSQINQLPTPPMLHKPAPTLPAEDLFVEPDISSENPQPENAENAEEAGEEKSKFKIIAAVAVLVLCILVMVLRGWHSNNEKTKANDKTVNTQESVSQTAPQPSVIIPATNTAFFKPESLNPSTDEVLVDNMLCSKYVQIDSDGCHLMFSGTTGKLQQPLTFEVTLETYNKYSTGDVLQVQWSTLEINSVKYIIDVQVI